MKHYNREQWAAYKAGQLDLATSARMEEHLLLCEDCLDVFLNLISEEEICEAALFVPDDFLSSVLSALPTTLPAETVSAKPINKNASARTPANALGQSSFIASGRKKLGRKRTNLLIAYASAASITLFLMSNGFFSGLSSMAVASPDAPYTDNGVVQQLVASEQRVIEQYTNRLEYANKRLIDALTLDLNKGGN